MQEKPEIRFAQRVFQDEFYTMESLRLLTDFILVGGMTLMVIIIFVLLKARKSFSHKLLCIVFGSCFFFILYYYAFLHKSSILAAVAICFGYGLGFLMGPLIYAYIQSITLPQKTVLKSLIRSLIPYFLFWTIVSVPMALNMLNRSLFTEYAQGVADIADYINIIENTYLLVFFWFSRALIGFKREILKSQFSNLEKRDLRWCKKLIEGLTIIIMLDIGLSIYELLFPPTEVIWNVGLLVAFAMIFLFGYLGYRGIFQEKILLPDFLLDEKQSNQNHKVQWDSPTQRENIDTPATIHYLKNLSETELDILKARLLNLLENEGLYANEKLTLSDLAKRLDIPDKKLSEFLNQHLKTNFYDLVNTYRVESVKNGINNPDFNHLTLLGIALESGFQSKSSFNRVFKNKTGMSPSEFKRKTTPPAEEVESTSRY